MKRRFGGAASRTSGGPHPHWVAVQRGRQQQTGGWNQLVVARWKASRGVETVVETGGQFSEICPEAVAGIRVAWGGGGGATCWR